MTKTSSVKLNPYVSKSHTVTKTPEHLSERSGVKLPKTESQFGKRENDLDNGKCRLDKRKYDLGKRKHKFGKSERDLDKRKCKMLKSENHFAKKE